MLWVSHLLSTHRDACRICAAMSCSVAWPATVSTSWATPAVAVSSGCLIQLMITLAIHQLKQARLVSLPFAVAAMEYEDHVKALGCLRDLEQPLKEARSKVGPVLMRSAGSA